MPIMSYLVYPNEGRKEELAAALAAIPACEVRPADNAELLLLVTDTPDSIAQKALDEQLRGLDALSFLGLVAGYSDDEANADKQSQASDVSSVRSDLDPILPATPTSVEQPHHQSSDRS